MLYRNILLVLSLYLVVPVVKADEEAPWGHAQITQTDYMPMKVVYDVTSGNLDDLVHVLELPVRETARCQIAASAAGFAAAEFKNGRPARVESTL